MDLRRLFTLVARRSHHHLVSSIGGSLMCFALWGLIACGPSSSAFSGASTHPESSPPPLPQRVLRINGHDLKVEVAQTEEAMARGLMFRRELDHHAGMLFVFPAPRRASFWMKNTLIPLSIAYVDDTGRIDEILPLEPLDTVPVPSRSLRIQYAIETNRGWFEQQGISPGHSVENLPRLNHLP